MTRLLGGKIAIVAGATRGAAGGDAAAVRVDHSKPEEVQALRR